MEDEQGDLGRVSDSPLSNNSPSERNQVEGSYEDGGEIMVEVVGSDVLVDGVSGNKESDLGLGEVMEPDGTQNFLEAMDVSTEGDGSNKIGETAELKLSVSMDEKNYDAVGGSECGVWSRGAASVSSNEVGNQSAIVQTDIVTVITEDGRNEDRLLKNSAEFVKPELLNGPMEAVIDKEFGVYEKEESLPLAMDKSTDRDYLGADRGMLAHGGEVILPSEVSLHPSREQSKDVQVDGINIVVGEVDSVPADVGKALISTSGPDDGNCGTIAEHAMTDGACGKGVKLIDRIKSCTAETKYNANSEVLVSDGVDDNQSCSSEHQGKKFESNHGTDDVSHGNSKIMEEKSVAFERVEAVSAIKVNDGASDGNSVDNEKCKTDGGLETDPIYQNHAFSNEPTQLTDGFDTAEVNKDKSLTVVHVVETVENQPNATISNFPGDDKIVRGEPGIYENLSVNAAPVGKAITDQKAATTEVDSKMLKKSLDCDGGAEIPALDQCTENVDFSCANVTVTNCHATVNSQACSENVVADFGPVQIVETLTEGMNSMPKGISTVGAVSDITQTSMLLAEISQISEKADFPLADIIENSGCNLVTSSEKVNMSMEVDDNCCKPDGLSFVEGQTSDVQLMDFKEERETNRMYHDGMAELGNEGPTAENDDLIFFSEDELVKSASPLQMYISGSLLPAEDEGQFSALDLVWGKVRSHPWWPGQVFNSADASEKAVKHYRKDAYLIAYFGDQTFAWNDASELKPFRAHFSEIEKQNNSEAFQNAVSCALGEISRRVELGLSCSCIPKDAYSEIESQVVENTGIREESSRQYGLDRYCQAVYFEPDKLLDYIKDLANHAASGADRLDLAIARAQLSVFCQLKGYYLLPGFPSTGELLESDADAEQVSDTSVASLKCTPILENDSQSRKEKSLTELMGERESFPDAEDDSLSTGRKRKALDPLDDGLDKRVSTAAAKYPTTNQPPKPSFKIGECIRRVASQLKGNNDETNVDGSPRIYEHCERRSVLSSAESYSSDEILSQLQLLALDPKRGESILNNIHTFFMGFRSSIALNRRGRKKKTDSAVGGSGEEFEFDDVNDSYWTDRIVHNYPEEELLNNTESREGNLQPVSFSDEKTVRPGRKSRKRFSSMSYPMGSSEIEEIAKRKKQEASPAELILNFAERNCLPSEINLNKMFRRFGPLMESETEVDHDSGRAKVIFKRGSDAEVARNSSEKFNIFGPVLVNYQIGYSPLISVKISPLAIPQSQEDVTLLI